MGELSSTCTARHHVGVLAEAPRVDVAHHVVLEDGDAVVHVRTALAGAEGRTHSRGASG
jgi:hypothetical protein